MGDELDIIDRPGWRLYDTRCFGYLAHVDAGRPFVAAFDRAATFTSADAAERVAVDLEPGRWRPVDRPQPPHVGPINLTRRCA